MGGENCLHPPPALRVVSVFILLLFSLTMLYFSVMLSFSLCLSLSTTLTHSLLNTAQSKNKHVNILCLLSGEPYIEYILRLFTKQSEIITSLTNIGINEKCVFF